MFTKTRDQHLFAGNCPPASNMQWVTDPFSADVSDGIKTGVCTGSAQKLKKGPELPTPAAELQETIQKLSSLALDHNQNSNDRYKDFSAIP